MAQAPALNMDLLGMSHAISVLRAAAPGVGVSHTSWTTWAQQPGFQPIGPLPGDGSPVQLRAHLIIPGVDCRAVVQTVDGRPTVAAAPAFIEIVSSLDPQGVLVSFLGGNEHSVLSLLNPAVPFDFVWPASSTAPLRDGHQPVALAVVEAQLLSAIQQTLAQLTMIRARHPALRIVHVAPPPPQANEDRMRDTPEVFGDLIARHGLMPLSIRLKYYGVYLDLFKRHLAPLRIDVLGPPPESLDEHGALRDGLTLGCTHGNEAYGTLVLQQLRQLA